MVDCATAGHWRRKETKKKTVGGLIEGKLEHFCDGWRDVDFMEFPCLGSAQLEAVAPSQKGCARIKISCFTPYVPVSVGLCKKARNHSLAAGLCNSSVLSGAHKPSHTPLRLRRGNACILVQMDGNVYSLWLAVQRDASFPKVPLPSLKHQTWRRGPLRI